MKKTELKQYLGKFGKISGGRKGFEKTVYGYIKDIDTIGAVWFMDNDGIGHYFAPSLITSFEEQEFKDKTK